MKSNPNCSKVCFKYFFLSSSGSLNSYLNNSSCIKLDELGIENISNSYFFFTSIVSILLSTKLLDDEELISEVCYLLFYKVFT